MYLETSRDPALAARMRDGVKYISPLFILNYNSGAGRQAIDYITIEKVKPTGLVRDPQFLTDSGWVFGTNSSAAQIVRTNVAGEFNVLVAPSSETNIFGEVFRPEFHKTVPRCYQLALSARVFSTNSNAGFQFGIRYVSRSGSLIGDVSGLAPSFSIAINTWVNLSAQVGMDSVLGATGANFIIPRITVTAFTGSYYVKEFNARIL